MVQFNVGEFTPVAEKILVAVAEPAGVNIGLVIGKSGCLVIDTGSSPAQGAVIRRAAERASGLPVVGVLVTHWHYDHLFGLAGFAGVPSYGHDTVAAWLSRAECREGATGLGVEMTDLVAPSQSFSLARVIDVGGRRVEVVHFGRGHSDGDVVAIVPDAGVIFAGDLLESAGPPEFGSDSYVREWPSAVDGILGLVAEETVIVPGHGAPMDRLAAFTQRAEISALYGQVEHLISRGVRLPDAYAEGEWPFDEATVKSVLPRLYADFAATGLTPRTQLPLL